MSHRGDDLYGPLTIGGPCKLCGMSNHAPLTCEESSQQQHDSIRKLLKNAKEKVVRPANYGPFYAAGLYPKLAEIFRAHGYALAVHGSLASDFDLIAVPWIDEAGAPEDVIKECLAKFAFEKIPDQMKPAGKPHSRTAYKLHLSFGDCALDISFTPRTGNWWTQTQKISVIDAPPPGVSRDE